jgi:hypothetical protein
MKKSQQSKINVKELENVLTHVINTNKHIQSQGKIPLAINVVGQAGLGKTTSIKNIGKTLGFKDENIVKLNLSTLEEIGDLIGVPVVEYKVVGNVKGENDKPEKVTKWVPEGALSTYEKLGWQITPETQMNYSVPAWIQGVEGPGILILDDYTRASQRFTQAVMELILEQEYLSWKLPKGWTIILSSNPDDGLYNVTDQDPAQRSRYINVELGWNAEVWAEWAEQNGIDSRCINFTLMHQDIVKDEVPEINPRSITLFYESLSTIQNFNADKSLELIQLLGEGSLGVEATIMFTNFIDQKLDKLISTAEILDVTTPFKDIQSKMDSLINGDGYRADIAFVLTTRLINHVQFVMKNKDITDDIIKRLEALIISEVLGADLKFVMSRKFTNMTDKPNINKLLLSDAVVDNILND